MKIEKIRLHEHPLFGSIEVDFTGKVSVLLDTLCNRFGNRFKEQIMISGTGSTRNPFVKILVNGEDIRDEDPVLKAEDILYIFLPVAGG